MSARKLELDNKICNGDGQEGERLYMLSVGHVLTESDIKDIRNLLADWDDELENSIELSYQMYEQALKDAAPSKVELVNRVSQLEAELAAQKALSHYYQKCSEFRAPVVNNNVN